MAPLKVAVERSASPTRRRARSAPAPSRGPADAAIGASGSPPRPITRRGVNAPWSAASRTPPSTPSVNARARDTTGTRASTPGEALDASRHRRGLVAPGRDLERPHAGPQAQQAPPPSIIYRAGERRGRRVGVLGHDGGAPDGPALLVLDRALDSAQSAPEHSSPTAARPAHLRSAPEGPRATFCNAPSSFNRLAGNVRLPGQIIDSPPFDSGAQMSTRAMRSWPGKRAVLSAVVSCLALGSSSERLLAQPPPRLAPARGAAVSASTFDRIAPLVEAAIAEQKLPGAVVLVGRGDTIVYERAFGNRALGRPSSR